MEYAKKHYVIPQNQLNKLRGGNVRETIQQVVENDLEVAIRTILQRSDLDPHGKAKLYSNVLQRFLTIVKRGFGERHFNAHAPETGCCSYRCTC